MKKLVKPSSTNRKTVDEVSLAAHQAFIELLERPARNNAGLKDLFSRAAPWHQQTTAQSLPAVSGVQEATGLLADRSDTADPAAYVRKLRAPRF